MTESTARLQAARDRLADIDRRMDDLRIDRELARREIELLVGATQPTPRARTERLLEALGGLGEASPAQLAMQLRLMEPDVDAGAVRATLTYLLAQGRVIRPRRGRYRVVAE